MSVKIETNSCCGVVVTFFPDESFEKNIALIFDQIQNVIIVDNSATHEVHKRLEEIAKKYSATLIKNDENLGIAEALNQGVEYSKQIGAEWLLCFDQDSRIKSDFIDLMRVSANFQPDRNFLLGCNYIDAKSNRPRIPVGKLNSRSEVVERKTVITSGMLVPMHLLELIGGFRADYFIDSVDHEFCLRARRNNFRVLMTLEIGMSHLIGAHEPGQNRVTSFIPRHNSVRKYYMTRNALLTAKEYWPSEKMWGMKQVVRIIVETLSVILFEDDKQKKLIAIFKGFRDAVKNQSGAL